MTEENTTSGSQPQQDPSVAASSSLFDVTDSLVNVDIPAELPSDVSATKEHGNEDNSSEASDFPSDLGSDEEEEEEEEDDDSDPDFRQEGREFWIGDREAENLKARPLLPDEDEIFDMGTSLQAMDDAIGRTLWVDFPADLVRELTAFTMSDLESNLEARAIWHHPSESWTYRSNSFAHKIPFLINYLGGKYRSRVPSHILPAPRLSDNRDEQLPFFNYLHGTLKFEYVRCNSEDLTEYQLQLQEACDAIESHNQRNSFDQRIKKIELTICPSDDYITGIVEWLLVDVGGLEHVTLRCHDHHYARNGMGGWRTYEDRKIQSWIASLGPFDYLPYKVKILDEYGIPFKYDKYLDPDREISDEENEEDSA